MLVVEDRSPTLLRLTKYMGRKAYPKATKLLIMADAGGSNASRSRLWKVGLQHLANLTGLHLQISHFPPGTSKWNKMEHRMFLLITQNWRARPLVSYQTTIRLITNTRTTTGLRIKAKLTQRTYPTGVEISAAEMARLNLKPDAFHGDWKYSLFLCCPNDHHIAQLILFMRNSLAAIAFRDVAASA